MTDLMKLADRVAELERKVEQLSLTVISLVGADEPAPEPDAISDLSERELWLMRQAFEAGKCGYEEMQNWLDEDAADAVTTRMVLEKDAPPLESPWTYYADCPIPSDADVIVECYDGGKERWKAIAYEHEGHIIESGGEPIPVFYIVRWKPIL